MAGAVDAQNKDSGTEGALACSLAASLARHEAIALRMAENAGD